MSVNETALNITGSKMLKRKIERDFKRTVSVILKDAQRWQCPILNSTLKSYF